MVTRRRVLVPLSGITGAFALVVCAALPAMAADGVTADPDSGAVGDAFTVSGSMTCPSGGIMASFIDPAGVKTETQLGQAPREADGTYVLDATVPATLAEWVTHADVPVAPGSYQVRVQCLVGETPMVYDDFTVTAPPETPPAEPPTDPPTEPPTEPPTDPGDTFTPPDSPPADAGPITASLPDSVAPGSSFTLTEPGFIAGEAVNAVLYSSPIILASANAGPGGMVTLNLTIPGTVPTGQHTLVLFANSANKSAPLTVQTAAPSPVPPAAQAPPAAPDPSSGVPGGHFALLVSTPQLAESGSNDASPVLLGLALALIAVGASLVTRRRISEHR